MEGDPVVINNDAAPPAPPAPVDSPPVMVRVGDRELTVEQAQSELENLSQYRNHAQRVVLGSGEMDEDREQSIRFLMDDAGYTPRQIEDYIAWSKQYAQAVASGEDPGDDQEEDVDPADWTRDMSQHHQTGGEDPRDNRIAQLEARLEQMERSANRMGTHSLEQELERAVTGSLDGEGNLGVLLKRFESLGGISDKRKGLIADEVKRQTMQLVQRRQAAGGQFHPEWFREESRKAADMVADRYRSVIGDPDKLQRAPETVGGLDHIRKRGPAPEPRWEAGDDMSKSIEKARSFATSRLEEALADLESGDRSRV